MESVEELYQELILDHSQNPRCRKAMDNADGEAQVYNPLCGDEVKVMVSLKDGLISDVTFLGNGCSISQASASMMGELCSGKSIAEVRKLYSEVTSLIKGPLGTQQGEGLGDVVALGGVRKFPARQRCAMIAWEAIMKCFDDIEKKNKS